ncbi:MAG TPA: dienelactone hydrolase family protein [Gemmatimonadaceae bacterium]
MDRTMNAPVGTRTVIIPAGAMLPGDLSVPADSKGIVVFAHGSGSTRKSRRNQRVAARLQDAGFATLLFDLLTSDEESLDTLTGQLRFDVPLLAERLAKVTDWLRSQTDTRGLGVGYFGASTGAAAALVAAAALPTQVRAIVSRGGRPDLAGPYLARVAVPTLLIVGGADAPVIGMNQSALRQLASSTKQLVIVPGATHLFEEPGALDRVSELAVDWFEQYLADARSPSAIPAPLGS